MSAIHFLHLYTLYFVYCQCCFSSTWPNVLHFIISFSLLSTVVWKHPLKDTDSEYKFRQWQQRASDVSCLKGKDDLERRLEGLERSQMWSLSAERRFYEAARRVASQTVNECRWSVAIGRELLHSSSHLSPFFFPDLHPNLRSLYPDWIPLL